MENEITKEIDRLRERVKELEEKLLDVVRGNFPQICSFCGFEAKPPNGWAELQEHIHSCPVHPLAISRAQNSRLKAELADARLEIDKRDHWLRARDTLLAEAREALSDTRFRLKNPYEAFLRDSLEKDNCRNCKHSRPPTISHNPDRISCKYADGWPHWTHKCDK